MNIEMLEPVIWIGCWTVIGLALLSIYFLGSTPGKRLWAYWMPLATVLIYAPYESYFHIPEVSLSVPIRVDLLLIIPLFEVMFLIGLMSAFYAVRKYQRPIGKPIALLMGIMAVLWPIYVAVFLMSVGR